MNFNLKNFPKTVEGENRDEADIWAEGFEKQERKRLSDARTDLKKTEGSDARHCGYLAGYIVAKKEILGENLERGETEMIKTAELFCDKCGSLLFKVYGHEKLTIVCAKCGGIAEEAYLNRKEAKLS